MTSIGRDAFFCCTGLTSITIPSSVTEIGDFALMACDALTSVTIGKNVATIGYDAFAFCNVLTSIVVSEENTKFDSRNNCNAIIETASNTLVVGCKNTTIPNSVTSIGDYAFSGCSGLTSVTIPNSVTEIGIRAFRTCTGLTSVTIPNSVTEIGIDAFYECTGLTSVTIPNSVTSIGDCAFAKCSSLTDVYCYATKVLTTGDYVFYNVPTSFATLHVPAASLGTYKTTEPWSKFGNIVALTGKEPTGVEDLSPALSQGEGADAVYDLSGRQMVNGTREALGLSKKLKKGIYIVNGKKVLVK